VVIVMLIVTLVALLAIFAIAVTLMMPNINIWLSQRRDARMAAMEAQMQAMLAAQRLSVLAWQTRQEMHQALMEERRSAKPES
jgi:hypothetical protein